MNEKDIIKKVNDLSVNIRAIVSNSSASPRDVLARYTAAFAVNFTDWIGKTIPWVRHERARFVLIDNLRCEMEDDHIDMLWKFSRSCGAQPDGKDYAWTFNSVAKIRTLFSQASLAGIHGLSLCTLLENVSREFIPDLATRASDLGCANFMYTDAHGEADVKHGEALLVALFEEMKMHPRNDTALSMASAYIESLMEVIYK